MELSNEKIKLHAVYGKKGIIICDQNGREFEAEPDDHYIRRNGFEPVLIGVELEAIRYPDIQPHVTISIRVPLEISERISNEMQEFLSGRI